MVALPFAFLAWQHLEAGAADKITTGALSAVSVILGFYFGREAVDEAREAARRAIETKGAAERGFEDYATTLESRIMASDQAVELAQARIEDLRRRLRGGSS